MTEIRTAERNAGAEINATLKIAVRGEVVKTRDRVRISRNKNKARGQREKSTDASEVRGGGGK